MFIHRNDPCMELSGLLGTNAPCATPLLTRDDPYVRFLLENRQRKLYVKPYNGNSGDVLIWLGSEQLLKDLHVNRTMDPRTADIILVPGGNQTMWPTNVNVWKEVWSKWPDKDFVVGPTTVRLGVTTWDEDVKQSKAHIKAIFARDPESYTTLRTCGLNKDIITGLSHDPALYLRGSELIRTLQGTVQTVRNLARQGLPTLWTARRNRSRASRRMLRGQPKFSLTKPSP